ncbi:MAG: hypothetical protein H6581_29730 [Bacteroidia bacterium]|nr:hypothetical protein [Bacteroidia bacterium]
MIEEKIDVFYSWQSDTDKKFNRSAIKDCLFKGLKALQKEENITEPIRFSHDTLGVPGSPGIDETIFKKIDCSNIFVCDVSIINSQNEAEGARLVPNPNVMIELGYAVSKLGWSRVLCVFNKVYGKIEDLPFDLRQHRIITFDSSKDDFKKELIDVLKKAINSIIINYDSIIQEFNQNDWKKHDQAKFEESERIIKGDKLIDFVGYVGDNCRYEKVGMDRLRNYLSFLEKDENQFLISKISTLSKGLIESLNDFVHTCAANLFSFNFTRPNKDTGNIIEIDQMRLRKYEETGMKMSEEEFDNMIFNNRREIGEKADKAIESYKLYRQGIKQNLLI